MSIDLCAGVEGHGISVVADGLEEDVAASQKSMKRNYSKKAKNCSNVF